MNFLKNIFKPKQQPIQYFRVFDIVSNNYFATGYNATSKEELVKTFNTYINAGRNTKVKLKTWEDVENYLPPIRLETSVLPFKEL